MKAQELLVVFSFGALIVSMFGVVVAIIALVK